MFIANVRPRSSRPGDNDTQIVRLSENRFVCDVVALFAGAVLPLAFAPFGLYPIAVLVLTGLFLSWLTASPRRAALRGWLFGLGAFGGGIYWVQISIHHFGMPSIVFSVATTFVLVAFMALYPALAAFLARRFAGTSAAVSCLLLFPAVWTLVEWLRGWLFTGFPWLNVGYSQIGSPLSGAAPVLGVYGVCWLTALSAGLCCLLFIAKIAKRAKRCLQTIAVLLGLWLGAGSLSFIGWTARSEQPFDVVLIQGNVPQQMKWHPDQRIPTLEKYLSLSIQHLDADVIVWPETAIPMFYREAEQFLGRLALLAQKYGTDFLIGVPFPDSDAEQYYNSMVRVGADISFYHKRHLVPFGEYLPLRDYLGPVADALGVRLSQFSAGETVQPPLLLAGHPAGISICFEDVFGEEVMDFLPEATLLVNASNDAWFGDSTAPHQHLEIARMRALEGGRYLLRSTNTGVSAIIDPKGRVSARSPQFEADALRETVYPYTGSTPYTVWGNWMILLMMLAKLCIAFLISRRAPAIALVSA